SPSFVDCTWTENYSANSGGGLYIYGAASSVSLSGCTFDQNESVKSGGGLVVYQGAVTIDGGAFVANRSESTTFGAGGLLVGGSGSATIVGTLFDGNVATNGIGPAMTMGDGGRIDLDGVTVVNHDASSGGVIHANADGEGSIANSEVCDNLGSPLEGPIENLGGNCIGEVCNSDSDGDGTEDCVDGCPDDPNKTEPGVCGCGVPDTGDSDGDGIPDCIDPCPTWPYDCSSDGMTLYVSPGESIQAAIDVAQNGWSVLVEPGTFAEAIDFLGKAITVEANAGAAGEVILDGTGLDSSIVVFVNSEGPDAVLRGFTLMYGTIGSVFPLDESVRVGGAVFAYQSSPTIEACHFEANRSGFGGAIYTYNGAPTIRECSFFQNHASSNGGAVQLSRSDGGLVEDCLLFENSAVGQGGGMHLFAGTPTVRRSEILDNTSGASGGGVNWYSTGDSALFAECVITGNIAKESGGGIKTRDGFEDLTLQGTTVCDNEPQDIDGAFIDGGGNTLCICPADFNGDGVVGGGDLGIMLANWDTPMSDLNGDGTTNGADLGLLLAGWGMCP
ncbi:MAG: right-handed parallel beta-helix repeat-containing protein, partial [Myxococcota bacterium]